ncbi:unnamed protein product [Tuber aestivum]|uniref:Uncharacterized protein n=1 Tax=Tuber aestivum TaxID=59557 RepID=A0A292PN26_9PEZI|nr:unnamed protein product [Tuber aestivum]
MFVPRVYTYHCKFCSNLFLASTHDFKTLPKRKPPGRDRATIVPLPPPPKSEKKEDSSDAESSEGSSSSSESESETEAEVVPKPEASSEEPAEQKELNSNRPPPPTAPFGPEKTALTEDTEVTKGGAGPPPKPPVTRRRRDKDDDYTLLLSLTKDRSAKIIDREDGFEKRWIWRCGRCRLIVGYQLDDAHFSPTSNTHPNTIATTGVMGGDAGADKDRAEKERKRAERKRKRYLYILPDACVSTGELGETGASGR